MVKIFVTDNKYKFFIIVMVVLFLTIVIGTIFFSLSNFFKKDEKKVAVVLNDGDLVFNYNDGVQVKLTSNTKYNVSITNTGETRLYYSILLEDIVANTSVSLQILDEEEEEMISYDKITEADKEVLSLLSIEGGETKRFILLFKGNNKKDFSANIKIINESNSSRTFADLILLNNEIKTSSTRIGSEIAKGDEGLISSEDEDGITYFFRGNVKNNYVILGATSFRIVRINGNGTVRLVLDDNLLTSAYNTKELEEKEESNTLLDYTKSSLYSYLETWINSNFSDYSESIVADQFCVDIDFSNYVNGINYSTAYDRIFLYNSPSLKCEGSRFKALAGLLSIDEVIFAGAVHNKENKNYYLYNSSIEKPYLLASPYFLNGEKSLYLMNIDTNGKLGEGIKINESALIRPVITIGTSAKVKGKGTKNDPYIIVS